MVKIAQHILDIKPYKPGKPVSEVERELGLSKTVKLASNENPLGPGKKVVEAIKKAAEEVNFYPDGNAYYLKQAIVDYHKKKGQNIELDQIVMGNGSNEVIDIAIRTLVGKDEELLVSAQAFIIYELISKGAGISMKLIPQTADYRIDIQGYIDAITEKTKLICLVNPNNPTGSHYSKSEFEMLLKAVPEGCVVLVDEAYVDFVDADDYPNSLDYFKTFPNMITTRTFSKAFGISGIRLGYAITSEEIAGYLNRIREPFNTNSLAQAAGIAALGDEEYLSRAVAVNKEGKEFYYKTFTEMGLEYISTQGNFILVKLGESPALGMEVFDKMLHKGVIVRPMAGYGFPNWIRISIGLPQENVECIKVLKECL
ncbi:histidinol-phosphate transaminase [bacterium]|nr:histidinol-phosphate transaminase [bacterium]